MAASNEIPHTAMLVITNTTDAGLDHSINTDELEGLVNDHLFGIMKVVIYVVLCQIVCVFGTVANIMNLIVFVKIGFSDTINITLTALSFTDFGACAVLIWETIAFNPLLQELNSPYLSSDILYLVCGWPHVIFTRMTTILTAFISLERCLCVILPLKVKTIITRKFVKTVVVFTFASGVLISALLFSTHWFEWRFDLQQNRSIIALTFSDNKNDVESVYHPIYYVAIPSISILIVGVSSILLVSALRKNSKWKREVAHSKQPSSSEEGTKKNQTVSSKEMKVAKMITQISIIYIFCSIPLIALLFMMTADDTFTVTGRNRNLLWLMGGVVFIFQCVNSSSNIFVYYYNSSVYKAKFNQIFRCGKEKQNDK